MRTTGPGPGCLVTCCRSWSASWRRSRSRRCPGQPPFAGGALGFLGYDWGRVLERRPAARYDDLAMPGAMFGLYDWAIAWDHEAGACWLVSTGLPATGDERARVAAERIEQVRTALTRADPPAHPVACVPRRHRPGAPRAVLPRARPRECGGDRPSLHVHRPRLPERGAAGARVHPRRRHLPGQPVAAVRGAAARRRRCRSTSGSGGRTRPPFAAYLAFDDVTVLSASPERFLRSTATRWRPGRSRAPGRADSARCTTRRSAASSPRARRTAPRT